MGCGVPFMRSLRLDMCAWRHQSAHEEKDSQKTEMYQATKEHNQHQCLLKTDCFFFVTPPFSNLTACAILVVVNKLRA